MHFEVKEKEHTVHLTDEGVREAEKLAGVETFYTAGNMDWPHLIDNSLKAHYLYKRDVNYVVQGDEVIIVDEFTGRFMPGRQWSDGLHQAVEAKEGVRVKEETQTYATITLQNFFKLYDKISGMTGTAMTEASEFWKIYKLDVDRHPNQQGDACALISPTSSIAPSAKNTTRSSKRSSGCTSGTSLEMKDRTHRVGTIIKEEDERLEIELKGQEGAANGPEERYHGRRTTAGRPILVGTVSIEKSERLSAMLNRRGIKHEVSMPSITSAKPKSSLRPAARAR